MLEHPVRKTNTLIPVVCIKGRVDVKNRLKYVKL